jgi:hypothetical protein
MSEITVHGKFGSELKIDYFTKAYPSDVAQALCNYFSTNELEKFCSFLKDEGYTIIEKGTQLFFARCWKCSKYDWKFGRYNGWILCSACLVQKLTENGILSEKEEKEEE